MSWQWAMITELVKFGLRIMYREGYQGKEV